MTDFQKVSKYVKDDLGIDVKMGQITAFMGHKNKTIFIHHNHNLKKNCLYTLLHEVGHALDAKRLGVRKYIKKYVQAGTMANYQGLHPHDDNKWEEKAERFP